MRRGTERHAKYYPKKKLNLKDDIRGAKMWAVALEKVMLTYFEIGSDTSFEMHSHGSEQITVVLEGELFFRLDDNVMGVKKGEVMAIPSDMPHAVFTRKSRAKAIDAWSPVMKKYRDHQP